MKAIRVYIETEEQKIDKCLEMLDMVLTKLFHTEDIVFTVDICNTEEK